MLKPLLNKPKIMDRHQSYQFSTMDNLNLAQFNSHSNDGSQQQLSPTWKAYKISALAFLQFSWVPPLVIAILLPVLCIGSYISALHHNQIEPILPFVSDAGTSAPQAAYFSHSLDVLALLVFLTAIARFKQLRYYIQTKLHRDYIELHNQLAKLNRISVCVAFLDGLLMIMVGNFRTTESNTVHFIAATAMLSTMLFCVTIVTYISYRLWKVANLESNPITLGISIAVAIVSYVLCVLSCLISIYLFEFDNFNNIQARLNWAPGEAGYIWHVLSTALEWATIHIFPLMYLCLCRRMYRFEDWVKV